jgi:hypothetical protein
VGGLFLGFAEFELRGVLMAERVMSMFHAFVGEFELRGGRLVKHRFVIVFWVTFSIAVGGWKETRQLGILFWSPVDSRPFC